MGAMHARTHEHGCMYVVEWREGGERTHLHGARVGDKVEMRTRRLHVGEELIEVRALGGGVERARAEGQDRRDRDLVVRIDEDQVLGGT